MPLNSELRNRIKLAVSNQIISSQSANQTRFIKLNFLRTNRYIKFISLLQERYYPKLLPAIGIV